MFRKKGVSEVEAARENEIKIAITQKLSQALKAIQMEKVDTQEQDVYSTDTANTVCNCIEAIFLHGLKSKAVTKIANYVGIRNQATSQPSLNFWNFVSRFTHGEVVAQLKHLGQITTEIGLCRAWVRVALNDGILESYVDAMVADKKTLEYFYSSVAYLRDSEQPGIMQTYLQGLMNFEFKLSYNASVLNDWAYAPLRLAGILDSQDDPPPIIRPAAKKPPETSKAAKRKKDSKINNDTSVEVTRVNVKSKGQRSKDDSQGSTPNPMEQPSFGNPPDNSYYVTSSHFTTADVEAFKRLGRAGPNSTSECSSSSHISAPDPPHMNASPANYVDRLERMKGSPMSSESNKMYQDSPSNSERADYDSYDGLEIGDENKSIPHAIEDAVQDIENETDNLNPEVDVLDTAGENDKPTDLEESWEEFYKSPLKKEPAVENLRKFKRLDSVNRDVREQALLQSILNSETSVEDNENDPQYISGDLNFERSVGDDNGTKDDLKENSIVKETQSIVEQDDGLDNKDTSDLLSMSQKLLNEIGIKDDDVDGNVAEDMVKVDVDDDDDDDSVVQVERVKSSPKKQKRKSVDIDNLKPQLSLSPPKSAEAELSDAVADTVVQIRTLENPDYLSKHRLSLPAVNVGGKQKNSGHRKSLPNIKETGDSTVRHVGSIYNDDEGTAGSPLDVYDDGRNSSPYNQSTCSPGSNSDHGDIYTTEPTFDGHLGEKRQSGSNNLLCSGRGWSSSFDSGEMEDTVDTMSSPRSNHGLPIARPKTESFGSLLQNYTPASSMSARSVDDVINNLPHRTETIISPVLSHTSEDDRNLEGFEVLSDSTEVDCAEAARLEMFTQISNEKGLDSQNFQCKGCSRALGLIFGKQRVCRFDGGYYCYECHENDEYYIPALIVHNWDYRKHKVSKKNLKFLTENEEQPHLNIDQLNPRLYDHVQEMQDIRILRTQLMVLKSYMFTCKQSIAEDFRKLLWPRDYLFESTELYSLADLLQVPTGALANSIKKVIKFATKHVYSCGLCSQKGFICELCHNPKVIYPFEMDSTYRCQQCKSVFHKECKTDNRPCPKCLRRASRQSFQGTSEIVLTPDYDQHMEHET